MKPAALFLTSILITCAGLAAETPSAETPLPEPAAIRVEDLMKLEIPVVEAASKYKQKITEAPSSITVITAEEVKRYGHRTLADMLASAPGLYATYDRNYSFLGVRGFNLGDYNNRILLLVDGHRMNNSLSDGALIGTGFLLDADLIDRVEIIRGPGSSLYGNNAFFGVVNVITRRGRDMAGHGLEVSGEAASYDTYNGRVTYGNRYRNGLELLLSGSLYDSQGDERLYYKEFNTAENNNGIAENADADRSGSFFGSVAFQDWTLQGGYASREKGNPTAQFLTDFNDSRLRTIDDRGYANLKYAHAFAEVVEVTAQVYYDRQDFSRGEPYGGTLYRREQEAEWWGAELQLTKQLFERHMLTLGGEYRDDFQQAERFLHAETGQVFRDLTQSRQNHGVYLQGDFAVRTNLHLNAGVRYDQYTDQDPSFNPRAALIYNPFGESVFKAIYGTAFRAPNFFEQYFDPRIEPLAPETIITYELVYEQGIGNNLRSSVAGFYNQIDDLIRFNSDPGHQRYENLEGAEAWGLEFVLDAFWPGGVRGRASYTLQETRDDATGEVLTDSPQHVGKLNLSAPVWKDKVFASVELQLVSSRTTVRLTPLGTTEAGSDVGGFGLVNFTLFSQNLVKGLDLSASVYNLLDTDYGDPSTPWHRQDVIAQDGRTFRVKLTYRF